MSNSIRKNKSTHKFAVTFFSIILTLTVAVSTFAIFTNFYFTRPVHSQSDQLIAFTIQPGESINQISQNLQTAGLIRHPFFFKLTAKRLGLATRIQAGNFQLNPSQSAASIVRSLTSGLPDQVQVTLIEGWRREEMAETLAQAFTSNPNFSAQEFIDQTADLEGRLFPDTYFFHPDVSTSQIISTLTQTFNDKIAQPLADPIFQSAYSQDQLLVMASIIEREARGSARPLVSGILWKRLENDWPLQADASLQYIKGSSLPGQTWWPTPLAADKDLASLYNTYQNPGLPPRPICNPSLDSFLAALNPQDSQYWYYISDLSGNMHYAVTYDQHLDNINTYLR